MNSLVTHFAAAVCGVSLAASSCTAAEGVEISPPQPGKVIARAAELKSDKGGATTLHYWEHMPEGTAPADGWPLLLFLHGSGERGTNLEAVKKHGPLRELGTVKELEKFLLIAPQCPPERWWDVTALQDLIGKVSASRSIDQSRIYVTGLSMGGFGTWGLLAAEPALFAAAAPVCGGGDPSGVAAFKDVPLWVFHGGKDEVVPLKRSQEMVDALKAVGAKPEFTVYPDAGHDSWSATYENPALYQWLLKYKK